jgi:Kdo2-lipid IVA lauroyltransferase/acyltransferase
MTGRRSKKLLDAAIGTIAVGLLRVVKHTDRRRAANFAGAVMRKMGPLLPEHRVGRDNLRAAFPEKTNAEIEQILAGAWDNLGRVAAEFVHLDEFHVEARGANDRNAIILEPAMLEHARRVIDGKATLCFACHTANWELSAVVVRQLGAKSAVLYRRQNLPAISDAVIKTRANLMGQMIPAGLDAPVRLAHLLQDGVHVTFFGRTCKANPLIALLARQLECPIYGLRTVRLPGGNSFTGDFTGPIEPARDAQGRVDVQRTMQAITTVTAGWVREHPEQWLWLHRRWR